MLSPSTVQVQGKGKARAEPTERDALLSSSSSSDRLLVEAPPRRIRHVRGILAIALIVLGSFILAVFLFLALLAYSFKPSEEELGLLPTTAFTYAGPDDIHVLNVTDDGILVQVSLRCGIDMNTVLGLYRYSGISRKEDAIAIGMRGTGAKWWESVRRWAAHRVLDRLPAKTVEVNVTDPILIFPSHFESPPLLSLRVLDNLTIPLVTGVDRDSSWLQPLTFTALAKPIASTGQLWDFVQHAWTVGEAKVVISVRRAEAKLSEGVWWARYGHAEKEDLVFSTGVSGESFTKHRLISMPHPFPISF